MIKKQHRTREYLMLRKRASSIGNELRLWSLVLSTEILYFAAM
jgi:hypothetical protein